MKKLIAERRKVDRRFQPMMDEEKRQKLYTRWKKAVECAKGWEEE
jgi:glycerol kinase